jgi:hypothetical protein
MRNTKLILIEGFPGAGKTTTTLHIGNVLQQQGIPCRWYLEEDDPHPIACLDYEIKGLPQKMGPLWLSFVDRALQEPYVTLMESRLWQNTALFMYMSEWDAEDILLFGQQLWQVLTPLSPTLIYLDQDDTETALRRLYTIRGEKWVQSALEKTTSYPWFQSRGLIDFTGWVQFFKEWQQVVEQLYNDWPYCKIKVLNPHQDWDKAYQQMVAFLQIELTRLG